MFVGQMSVHDNVKKEKLQNLSDCMENACYVMFCAFLL